jgi:hypothetical protein
MEAIGDQLAEFGGNVAVLTRASTPAGSRAGASDGGAETGMFDGGAGVDRPAVRCAPATGTSRYCRTPLAE